VLHPRIIPCLLVHNKGLVKTVRFREGKYVGDPINAVRIFNEKEADELMMLDIDATTAGSKPDMKMIRFWAAECRMPLCYGGGVTTVEEAKEIIGLGAEKVALSAAAIENPELVAAIAEEVGNQSVVVVLDVKNTGGTYEIWTHNATKNTGKCPIEFSRKLQTLGVGEIVLNSIDHDGEMKGYDLQIAGRVREAVTVPMSVLGGAGSLKDVGGLIQRFGIIGAAAGSLFVFKGVYKAVLINYPNPAIKAQLIRESLAELPANAAS
jgi:imidazole glycerol-phosphate synthase subunit HisF